MSEGWVQSCLSTVFPDAHRGVHLLLDLSDSFAPSPRGDLAFVKLVNLSG